MKNTQVKNVSFLSQNTYKQTIYTQMHVAVCCTRCIYHCKEYVIFLPHSRHLFTLSSAITWTDDISKLQEEYDGRRNEYFKLSMINTSVAKQRHTQETCSSILTTRNETRITFSRSHSRVLVYCVVAIAYFVGLFVLLSWLETMNISTK